MYYIYYIYIQLYKKSTNPTTMYYQLQLIFFPEPLQQKQLKDTRLSNNYLSFRHTKDRRLLYFHITILLE